MLLRLPPSLHYPITVTELLKRPDDYVDRFAPLLAYTYQTTVTEGDGLGNENQVVKSYPSRYESNVEGKLLRWTIKKGTIIERSNTEIGEIDEPCDHSIQFGGMCAKCGKNMTEATYVTARLDAERATINMVHNNVSLTVSANEAERADDEAKRRLLAAKKLSLVVDLDQTIIHATVDPTVADWQQDENNPNHGAVKDVQAFLLKDDGPVRRGTGCWYYIKLRPGLKEFLENVAAMYEMHIYTMGTRQYAKNIADIIDPEQKIFGDRILSRDESGSMTAKNLQRLFPIDTKMVVIIDDRGDVWKWSPNLIKVLPYDFFVGIGDINSSFLPKRPELRTSSKPATAQPTEAPAGDAPVENGSIAESNLNGASASEALTPPNGTTILGVDAESSPLDHLVAMSGADGSTNLDEQTSSQDEALTVQLEEKPLLQKQKQLEADDAAAGVTIAQGDRPDERPDFDDQDPAERPRHSLLQDNDRELFQLENSLRSVHGAFFNAYAQQLAAAQGGRLAQLRGSQKRKLPTDKSDLDLVPDIKIILPGVKSKVLGGTVLVFSGIVPLGMDVHSTDIALLAKSFGATVHDDVSRSTTHVVAARNRTQKVRAALRRGKGRVKIVSPSWLLESISAWERKNEVPYLLDTEEVRNGSFPEDDILSDSESDMTDLEQEESDADSTKSGQRQPLNLIINPPSSTATEDEDSDAEGVLPTEHEVDDKSPVGGNDEDWSAMNNELADFLASGAEEDEEDEEEANDSEASTGSKLTVPRGRKRGRSEETVSGESGSETEGGKKRRTGVSLSFSRKVSQPTALSQSTIADENVAGVEDEANGSSIVMSNGKYAAANHDHPSALKPESRPRGGSDLEAGGSGIDANDITKGSNDAPPPDGKEEPTTEGDGWSDFGEEDFEAELERAGSEEEKHDDQAS